jgi:hypothetical protein
VAWTLAIPLNPTDLGASVLYCINMDRFTPVNARSVLGLKTRHVKALIPPNRDVRRGKPFLQERQV